MSSPSMMNNLLSLNLGLAICLAACGADGVDIPGRDLTSADIAQDLAGPDANADVTSADPDAVDVVDARADTLDMVSLPDSTTAPDGIDASDVPDMVTFVEGPPIYPAGQRHSPITPWIAERLLQIIANGPNQNDASLAKIGDSITVSTGFMHCFAGSSINLDGRTTLDGTINALTGYDRDSLAATVGWSTPSLLAGSPSPLEQELAAVQPRFATVMYGTNDIQSMNPELYANDMLTIAETLVARGVIPIMSSVPPRDDSAVADAVVPYYNGISKGIARVMGVPYVDFHQALLSAPGHGLAGDNLHPNRFSGGSCIFTEEGLDYGYNNRNLLNIEALDRARRVALLGESAPDSPFEATPGDGSANAPIEIPGLPFSDLRSTSSGGSDLIDTYSCSTANESGREQYYRLELASQTRIHASVHDRGDVDIDIHLLDSSGAGSGCLARDNRQIVMDLGPGVYYLVLDTWVNSSGDEKDGEYLLVVF